MSRGGWLAADVTQAYGDHAPGRGEARSKEILRVDSDRFRQ
jgi:hypothetical protein